MLVFRVNHACALVALGGLAWAPGCGVVGPPATPSPGDSQQANSTIKGAASRPLIVEWPATERSTLDAKIQEHIVVFRWTEDALEPLWNCKAEGGYKYRGSEQQKEDVFIRTVDQLNAQLPTFGKSLGLYLRQKKQLHTSATLVGRWESVVSSIVPEQLSAHPQCKLATHFISAMAAGAFRLSSEAMVAGGVALGSTVGPAVEGGTEGQKGLWIEGGKLSACEGTSASSTTPTEGCNAIVRIELTPLWGNADPSPSRAPALVAGSIGLAGAVLGVAFAARASGKNDDSKAHCDPNNATLCDPTGKSLRDSAVTSANVATVGALVGVAGLSLGTLLWFSAPSSGPSVGRATPGKTRLLLGPGGLQLQGAW